MLTQILDSGMETGEQVIAACELLLAEQRFDEVITWVEHTIESIPPQLHAQAWTEAFYAARAKGDTELAKQFMMAIDRVTAPVVKGSQH
ncbi:MAG: hypothetical protein ACPHER_02205 [Nevskiales bacterium]